MSISHRGFFFVCEKHNVWGLHQSVSARKSMRSSNAESFIVHQYAVQLSCLFTWVIITRSDRGLDPRPWECGDMFVFVCSAYIEVPICVLAGGSLEKRNRWGAFGGWFVLVLCLCVFLFRPCCVTEVDFNLKKSNSMLLMLWMMLWGQIMPLLHHITMLIKHIRRILNGRQGGIRFCSCLTCSWQHH